MMRAQLSKLARYLRRLDRLRVYQSEINPSILPKTWDAYRVCIVDTEARIDALRHALGDLATGITADHAEG